MACSRLGFLILISALLNLTAFATSPGKKPPEPKSVKNVGWVLHGTRVVNPGQTLTTGEGTLVNGYQIEAMATPAGNSPVFAGAFRAMLVLFSPSRPMPGQTPGKWYVGGSWTITHPGAGPKERARARTR